MQEKHIEYILEGVGLREYESLHQQEQDIIREAMGHISEKDAREAEVRIQYNPVGCEARVFVRQKGQIIPSKTLNESQKRVADEVYRILKQRLDNLRAPQGKSA